VLHKINKEIQRVRVPITKEADAATVPGSQLNSSRDLLHILALDWPSMLLILLIVSSFCFRLIWLDKPDNALIFDEKYYVNAARVILRLPVAPGDPYADRQAGLDPNTEHPPAAKLIIAASMRIFGDNAFGWRVPSVLFGTLAIPLLYGVVRRAGGTTMVALLAAYLFAFDNLVFVHGRIATLDIFLVGFLLLGMYCYLSGWPMLAGLACVAATLCKLQGLYGVALLVLWESFRVLRERARTGAWTVRQLQPLGVMIVTYIVTLPWLLGLLDSIWSSYKQPIDHLQHILSYGFSLSRPDGPQGAESNPWQWLVNEVPMTYLRTDVQELVNHEVKVSRATIFFRGAMNPYIIGMAPIAIAYAAWSAIKRADDLSYLVLALFITTYAPFWPAAIFAHRISYLFYFLPTLPSITVGIAQVINDPVVPRLVRWTYIGAVLLAFAVYFPFRQIPQ